MFLIANFSPVTESDKDLLEKLREHLIKWYVIVFKREAVVDETFIRKCHKHVQPPVRVDAVQFFSYSPWQAIYLRLSPRCEYGQNLQDIRNN